MKAFTHLNARTAREASRLLQKYRGRAQLNAGGTDLLAVLKDKILPEYPEAVINIKKIAGLSYIKEDRNGLKIGALTRLSEVARSETVRARYTILAEAAASVATPTVRNMCTIGGNLAQHVRCWYYRYPHQIGGPITCLRKGGKICNALVGDNRYHSIFGAAPLDPYPCSFHCPAHTDIPSYLDRIRKGDTLGAAQMLLDFNPLPAITGRVCPAPCETGCNRSEFDEAVAIRCIERSLGDFMLERAAEVYAPPETELGASIAIIGSGPAGLAASYYLRRDGYSVTVFERLPEPGGMLLYGIPDYRLEKDVVRKQINALKGMGITFEVGVSVTDDITLSRLLDLFKAVFVAGGAWESLRLNVQGEDAENVLHALDYIRRVNSGEDVQLGRKVIIIGGGSVAIDAARVAKRSGAAEAHLVCLECRDLHSQDRMLAQDDEIRDAEEEGIIIHPSLGVKEIITFNKKAVALDTVRCVSVRDADGTFNPCYDRAATAFTLEADNIIVAIGQTADRSLTGPKIEYSVKGTILLDEETLKTRTPGLFAGGDIATGPSTVAEAISSGRKAARSIELSLNKRHAQVEEDRTGPIFINPSFDPGRRLTPPKRAASERIKSRDTEDIPSAALNDIEREAHRCFNCGCAAVSPTDIGVVLVALDAKIVTTKRTIDAQHLFPVSATRSTILDADEMITGITIPRPRDGTRQTYTKFTLRTPIDFAIASVAAVITVEDDVCTGARIVLGGVAPVPVRATAAEELLKGRGVGLADAARAAETALVNAIPLSMNAYKVEITKSLITRVISTIFSPRDVRTVI
jgi:NADPH-dependent glutamate synthase beta subunit-like oxidoreductase